MLNHRKSRNVEQVKETDTLEPKGYGIWSPWLFRHGDKRTYDSRLIDGS